MTITNLWTYKSLGTSRPNLWVSFMTLLLSPCRVSTSPTVKGHTIGLEQAPCRTQGNGIFTFSFDSFPSKEKHFRSHWLTPLFFRRWINLLIYFKVSNRITTVVTRSNSNNSNNILYLYTMWVKGKSRQVARPWTPKVFCTCVLSSYIRDKKSALISKRNW